MSKQKSALPVVQKTIDGRIKMSSIVNGNTADIEISIPRHMNPIHLIFEGIFDDLTNIFSFRNDNTLYMLIMDAAIYGNIKMAAESDSVKAAQ